MYTMWFKCIHSIILLNTRYHRHALFAFLIFLYLLFTKNNYTKQSRNHDNLTFVNCQNIPALTIIFIVHSEYSEKINQPMEKRQQKKLNILHNN